MPGCPSCGRPVALERPSCLYCGAPLPPEQVAAAATAVASVSSLQAAGGEGSSAFPGGPTLSARVLLVLDLSGVPDDALGRATGLSAYESRLLARRGGLHLHRALGASEAQDVATQVAKEGIRVFQVPEAQARARPLRATSGARRESCLVLRGEEGPVELCAEDLLLVVSGPIAREHAPRLERSRVETARLAEGWLVHLHRGSDPRPVEIDAVNFSLGFAVTGSARLEIDAWIDAIAPRVARDDGFRRLSAALAPAEPEPRGPLAAVSSLRRGSARPAWLRPGQAPEEAPPVLDNVWQFRFYSGWRAAVERQRRGSPAPPSAC